MRFLQLKKRNKKGRQKKQAANNPKIPMQTMQKILHIAA